MTIRTGLPHIALAALLYFYLVPLLACQPAQIRGYTFDLEDGEHLFVMNSPYEAASEYPVSGVYRKGPGKRLLWEYPFEFLDSFDLQNRISANGRYFVRTHPPNEGQTVYLSIYDNGELIREFDRDTFIDDVSQVYSPVCQAPYWAIVRYDQQSDRVEIESAARRVVTIDIPAAEILSVEAVRRMRIDGVITYQNGSRRVVRKIGSCPDGRAMRYSRKPNELIDAPVFTAFENGEQSMIDGASYFSADTFDVYLDQVQSMVFGEVDENGHYPVEVRLADGAYYRWHVSSSFTVCGVGEAGRNLDFRLGEFRSLTITLARP